MNLVTNLSIQRIVLNTGLILKGFYAFGLFFSTKPSIAYSIDRPS